jgi:lipopolysaccharide transport system ATP-binding protein
MTSHEPVVISVRDISKRYYVYDTQRTRLRHALWPSTTHGVSEVWALQNLNFDLQRGESLGIIGRNGAGKSSLLQIITHTLTPTHGNVTVNGRVAALLELGSGFNPEYSGRENVMLNGLLLGLTRAQVLERFDDIASFADIGNVLDRPVKTYSSGMLVRLAFAVQVALDPDVLIVDEALSVGDYFFQQKCFARLRKMRDDGLTLLFVSHDMSTVRDTCERVLYLQQGRQIYLGDAQEATRRYFTDGLTPASSASTVALETPTQLDPTSHTQLAVDALWCCPADHAGRLLAMHVLNAAGQVVTQANLGETLRVRVTFRRLGSDRPLAIRWLLKNKYDQLVCSIGTNQMGIDISDQPSGVAVFEFAVGMTLEGGRYSCKAACMEQLSEQETSAREDTGWLGPLQVSWDYGDRQPPFFGMFGLPITGKLQ